MISCLAQKRGRCIDLRKLTAATPAIHQKTTPSWPLQREFTELWHLHPERGKLLAIAVRLPENDGLNIDLSLASDMWRVGGLTISRCRQNMSGNAVRHQCNPM